MVNYAGLRPNQNMPLAALVQLALNATGAGLSVDGAYGRKSVQAVKDFQRDRKLGVDGVLGKSTWARLMAPHKFKIGDIADGYEKKGWAVEVADLQAAGAAMSVGYPMSTDKSGDMFKRIFTNLDATNLAIIRFHGHGYAGGQVMVGATARYNHDHLVNTLDVGLLAHAPAQAVFKILSKKLGPYGSIQLNGCGVGRGQKGRKLLRSFADVVGVPVCAGTKTQYAGGKSATFYMEGDIETQCPGGLSLKSWAQKLPALSGFSPI